MEVIFDDQGFPYKINLDKELQSLLNQKSNLNFYELEKFYKLIKPVIKYWNELDADYNKKQYGNITKVEYQKTVTKLLEKYFKKEIEKVRFYSKNYQI